MSAMDKHMQHMRDMHKKMAEAKTDQERQALMAEHKKAMHDGMKMMGGSAGATGSPSEPSAQAGGHSAHAGGGMGAQMMQRHALMEKRMEMMQTMMQMMMDHMHAPRASQ